jgi:hypothetical protein
MLSCTLLSAVETRSAPRLSMSKIVAFIFARGVTHDGSVAPWL